MSNKFIRQLIAVEIKLGFLNIPAQGMELMPNDKKRINVKIDGEKNSLHYNPEYHRIFGLTKWYKKHKVKPEDSVLFVKVKDDEYELSFTNKDFIVSKEDDLEDEELDLSGLSTQAKGDIVEDRIKEFLLLHGQGLLSVYKPVSDTEGIDLIVVRNGQFHPIFLQVKGRYTLNGLSMILRVKVGTFTPHSNFYVVGAYFNPKTLSIDDNIILIPSKDLAEKASKVNAKGVEWYSVVASLKEGSSGKWSKYFIKKDKLATKLIEKFEEMHKYIK